MHLAGESISWHGFVKDLGNIRHLKLKTMKVLTNLKYALSAVVLFLVNIALYAQERKVDVDIDLNKNESQWYNNPVVWVIGGAVFFFVHRSVVSGGNAKSREKKKLLIYILL